MNSIFILKEIAKWDKDVWRLFSLLNWEMNRYFCVRNREYELNFRRIKVDKYKTCYKLDGKRHRSDGPAVIYKDCEFWYVNGLLHRADGPAIIRTGYCKKWYVNGKCHRLEGPALEFVEEDNKKYNEWWINGIEIRIDRI